MGKSQANHDEIKRKMKELVDMLNASDFDDESAWMRLLWSCPLDYIHSMLDTLQDMHADAVVAVQKRTLERKRAHLKVV